MTGGGLFKKKLQTSEEWRVYLSWRLITTQVRSEERYNALR